jgi:hypothetical protein
MVEIEGAAMKRLARATFLAGAAWLLAAAAAWAQMPGMNMPVSAEEALRHEETLKSKPDDLEAHRRLALFFVARMGMPGMREQQMDSRRKYLQHAGWLIEKHAEAAGDAAPGLAWVKPEEMDALLALWKPVLEKRATEPDVLLTAAMYYTWRDLPRALTLLRDARGKGSTRAAAQLAATYFGVFVAASRNDLGAGLRPPLDGGMAPALQKELEASTDVEVYGAAGGWLVCFDRPSPRSEYVALGKRLVQRALAAEPGNARWSKAMDCVKRRAQ